jgi:hypothetical protein
MMVSLFAAISVVGIWVCSNSMTPGFRWIYNFAPNGVATGKQYDRSGNYVASPVRFRYQVVDKHTMIVRQNGTATGRDFIELGKDAFRDERLLYWDKNEGHWIAMSEQPVLTCKRTP